MKILLTVLLLFPLAAFSSPFIRWDEAPTEEAVTSYNLRYWIDDGAPTDVTLGYVQEYDLNMSIEPGSTVYASVQACSDTECGPWATAYIKSQKTLKAPTKLRFVENG